MANDEGQRTKNEKPISNLQSLISIFHLPYSDPYLWLTLLLSLPVVGPLLQPGYFWGAHDARHSVYFLHQFNQAIQDGVWYPRWSPDFAFGYGYPFFNIYGPLSFYVGQLFLWVGLDIVTSVKFVFGLSAILSGLTMYLFVRRLLGSPSGLIAALTYVYIPYHLFDLYVRAALAESVVFIFIPLTLWGFYEAVTRPRLGALLGAAVAYAGFVFTHPALAIVFTLISGLYVVFMMLEHWTGATTETRYEPFFQLTSRFLGRRVPLDNRYGATLLLGVPSLLVLGLGLGLSAISLLPTILEAQFVRTDQWFAGRFAFGDDFVQFFQLFSPRWGFGTSIPGPDDNTGFQIGLAATVLFILSFVAVPRLTEAKIRRTLYFYQATTLMIIFLTLPLSFYIWEFLSLAQLVQFPWRLLAIVAPFVSIITGSIVADIGEPFFPPENQPVYTALPLIILASLILLSSYPYLQAEVRDPKPTEGPVSQAALFRFQQSSDEMTGQTAWVQRIPNWSSLAEQVERGGKITTKVNYTALPTDDSVGVYSMEMSSVHELLWVGAAEAGQSITFLIPYYPGWQAYIYEDLGPHNGNLDKTVGPITRIGPLIEHPPIQTRPVEGWMVVPIPQGSHFLEIRFEDTIIRDIGFWISAITLLIIGLVIVAWRLPSKIFNISNIFLLILSLKTVILWK